MQKNKFFFMAGIFLIFQLGCGVKGRPVSPSQPPSIGHGETLYEQQKEKKENKTKTKNRLQKDTESSP